jgi:hypothetical protein
LIASLQFDAVSTANPSLLRTEESMFLIPGSSSTMRTLLSRLFTPLHNHSHRCKFPY